jgi:O-antigen ligase
MIGSTIWLLGIANAKTALVCFLLAIAIVAVLARTPLGRRPRLVVAVMVLGLLAAVLLDFAFDIKESGIRALNRNPTLTDRTAVWADVLAVPNNPFVGTGFESFWLGPRVETLWKKYWWRPNQAHNGWIETYINLGAVGLVLLSGVIVSGFRRILKTLPTDHGFGRLRLAFLISILLFNYTDATFKALHALYFLFFLIVSDYPRTLCPPAPRARLHSPSSTRQLPAA